MGWGFGINHEGREVGYTVEATCDEESCLAKIDRGLAYACGDMHDGGEWGCGKYFCGNHLLLGGPCQLCPSCFEHHKTDEFAAAMCKGSDEGPCLVHSETKCEKCNGTGSRLVAGEPTQEICGECSGEGVVG